MRWLVILLFAGLGLAAGPAVAKPQRNAAAEITALTREFVEGFNSGDVDRMMRFYAPQYVDVNMRNPHQTFAERREYYRKIVADGRTKVAVTPREIQVSGNHAFVWGSILLTRDGEAKPRELRYVEVWRQYPDGWKSIWGMDAELYDTAR
jgi:ketosteroid isomerase-like protein